jgi:uncharacterized protein (TIGR03435 family)
MKAWVIVWGFLAVGVALGQGVSVPMAKAAQPSFEVVTIKLSDPDSHRQGIGFSDRYVAATGQTLKSLMMFAYGLHPKQIVEAPAWAESERYDVRGLADVPGEPSLPQMQEMYRKLLAARFGLEARREQRDMAHYAIRVAKGGAKIAKASAGDDGQPDQTGHGTAKGMEMRFTSVEMSDFALCMNYYADEPVVDETGLAGRYDFMLRWTPNTLAQPDAADQAPGLFTAMQDQLGLKLEPVKGPVEVLAVVKAHRPSGD